MVSNKINILSLRDKDVDDIVYIHKIAFKEFFLTSLGDVFLKIYYKAVVKHKKSIAIGAFYDGKLIGFSVGAIEAKGYNKGLVISSPFSFTWALIVICFSSFGNIIRLYKNFTKSGGDIKDTQDYSELYSIAVFKDCEVKGVGSLLIHSYEKEVLMYDVKKVSLTTDVSDNESVLQFYKRNGYSLYYEFIAFPERKMYRLIKNL